MSPDYVYGLIKNMHSMKRVNADGFFIGLDSADTPVLEYAYEGGSGISIVCPKDLNGDFFLVEIRDELSFIKITQHGTNSEVHDLSTEESFFQENTITDLVLSFEEYHELKNDFDRYYKGYLHELTVYLRGKVCRL